MRKIKEKKKIYIYNKKKEVRKRKEKRAIKQKGDKMPQSKWWKQCICTVLEIRMHEYVENMANG